MCAGIFRPRIYRTLLSVDDKVDRFTASERERRIASVCCSRHIVYYADVIACTRCGKIVPLVYHAAPVDGRASVFNYFAESFKDFLSIFFFTQIPLKIGCHILRRIDVGIVPIRPPCDGIQDAHFPLLPAVRRSDGDTTARRSIHDRKRSITFIKYIEPRFVLVWSENSKCSRFIHACRQPNSSEITLPKLTRYHALLRILCAIHHCAVFSSRWPIKRNIIY